MAARGGDGVRAALLAGPEAGPLRPPAPLGRGRGDLRGGGRGRGDLRRRPRGGRDRQPRRAHGGTARAARTAADEPAKLRRTPAAGTPSSPGSRPTAPRSNGCATLRGPCDAPQVTLLPTESSASPPRPSGRSTPAGKVLGGRHASPAGVKKTSRRSARLTARWSSPASTTGPPAASRGGARRSNVLRPDGSLRYQLYDWGGPFVGLDNLRLVSDSAVRFVTHDRRGNMLLYAWSDGGNSVMNFQPQDVRTGVGFRGPGPEHRRGRGAELRLPDPPGPGRLPRHRLDAVAGHERAEQAEQRLDRQPGLGRRRTVCISGRSAWGLWQTPNKLTDAPPQGEYVAVLSPELDRARFCSVGPGGGGGGSVLRQGRLGHRRRHRRRPAARAVRRRGEGG